MKRLYLNLIVIMWLVLLSFVSNAGIYMCPGTDGEMEFTDVPCKEDHVSENNLEYVNKRRQSKGQEKLSSRDQNLIIKNYNMSKKDYDSYLEYVKFECGDEPSRGYSFSEKRKYWQKWSKCNRETTPILQEKKRKLESAERLYRDAIN